MSRVLGPGAVRELEGLTAAGSRTSPEKRGSGSGISVGSGSGNGNGNGGSGMPGPRDDVGVGVGAGGRRVVGELVGTGAGADV
ncbi:hypothetical protein [Actinopolymorpha alba]|uniref:hypothetical protein n=1 Tax=Actinopolymorpha alba TaxID=533267 RepID=UPI000375069D|nr:hypothetical protein [Actinopolymorpha alba]